MRLISLFALLLAASGQAQIVPISGRVSAPLSGAGAGAMRTESSALELSGSSFLAPSLSASSLGAPAIAPLQTALIAPAAKSPVVAAAPTAPGSPVAITASVLSAPAKTPSTNPDEAAPVPTAAKNSGEQTDDQKKEEGETGSAPAPAPGGASEDGRAMFDGAADHPNEPVQAVDQNEPSEAEFFAAYGSRHRPGKSILQRFGIAGGLLAVNTIAYAAVPNDGTETGTLAHLSFGSHQFLTAVHNLSFTGLAESAGRAFSSMFMHANLGHIFGNMMMLVLFAPWVQPTLGWRRTLALYLAGGLAAAVAQALCAPNDFTLGASAAICALMGAALTIWRKPGSDEAFDVVGATFKTLAAVVLGGEIKNLITGGPISSGHVATLAHVVGAAVGLLFGLWYALGRARARAKERAATS